MTKPEDKFSTHRPRVGDRIAYKGLPHGSVSSVEGALCWVKYDDGSQPAPFIWCFRDGLNKLHDWPSKGSENLTP